MALSKRFVELFDNYMDRTVREVMQRFCLSFRRSVALDRFDSAHPCVFVLSTGRCGTKTLSRLANLCDSLTSYHEPWPKMYRLSKSAYVNMGNASASPILKEAFLALRENRLKLALDVGCGYIETSPHSTFLAPAIADAVPEVRFIHLIRNPVDVVKSATKRLWYAGSPFDSTRITPCDHSHIDSNWADYDVVDKNAWLWAETNSWIHKFLSQLPGARSIRLHSEQLFAGESLALESFFSFIGEEMPGRRRIKRVLGRQFNANPRRMPDSEWTPEDTDRVKKIVQPVAKEIGCQSL